ncbi:hypothetical protein [uncultured Flavobacterium sp.]|jgi:hypothetical protein|uniref:hypothetical protein n=1 Tax=uncultured Flavobacterium sp. TaxID=165435 RepID=UPI0030EE0683
MKLKHISYIVLFIVSFLNAQNNIKGDNFEFDKEFEEHPEIVLADNYNHYLFTVTNRDGMLSSHKLTLRKFDQKNQLVDTFVKDFAIDLYTLHNFHGVYVIDDTKIAFIVESYSNKRKINELIKYVFDKKTGTYSSDVISSHASTDDKKFGSFYVKKSLNHKFIGITYETRNKKKEPEITECMVLNNSTFGQVFTKTVQFEDEFYTDEKIMSNSGHFIFLRRPRSYKETNYFVVISKDGESKKTIEENTRVHKPIAISIGTQDYLIAFNYKDKGIRRGDFGSILLYDLEAGKILKNNDIEDFNKIKDIEEVNLGAVFVENNQIRLFVEGRYKSGTKPSTTFPNSTMKDPVYNYGPSHLFVFSYDGTLTNNINLEVNPQSEPTLYHSFGMLNVKGEYIINPGTYYKGNNLHNWLYKINPNNNFAITYLNYHYQISDNNSYKFVNQVVYYFPDTNRFLTAAVVTNENKMGLLSFTLE